MSLVKTQSPSQSVGSDTSTWNAIGNPIVYKMQRKDYVFNQINNQAGAIQLQFNSVNIAASFTIGDVLYLQSDNGVYDMTVSVNSSTFSSPNTLVLCNEDYISAAPGGFVNNETDRPSYRVEVEVYNSDDELLNSNPLEISPTSKGALIINVNTPIRAYLSPDNDSDLTATTEVFDDTNAYLKFYIKYTEVWTGSAESQTDDVANQFFAVLGSRQIPSAYGGNMGEYAVNVAGNVINDTSFNTNWTNEDPGDEDWNLGATDLAVSIDQEDSKRARRNAIINGNQQYSIRLQFRVDDVTGIVLKVYIGGSQEIDFGTILTAGEFDETINFTADNDYTYVEVYASTVGFDINLIEIHDVTISEFGTLKFLTKFERPVMWRGYPFLISAIINEDVANDVYLNSDNDTTPADYAGKIIHFDLNQIITDQTVDDVDIAIYEDDTPDVPLSETLTIDFRDACDNPVYLLGRNSLGGALEWMFDFSQEYTFDYGNGRKAARKVLFTNNLTLNQWEALQDFITLGEVYRNNIVEFLATTIKTSSRIGQQVYVVESDGSKTGVIVIATKNLTKTRQVKHQFEIEIEYPEQFAV